ncbi:MAG TPA: hypothetical protein VGS98_01130 [Thermoanaerobaculia bacterium]|nr:hypothetical protein [Thermoanaerobaculia bacterium]
MSASLRAVQPAVSGLFQVHAPRAWVDALDGSGLPGNNGIPDFLDSWDAFSARTSSAILKNGYAFTTIDRLQDEVLYAGVHSASTGGPSSAVLEFSQKAGERSLGDLRISIEIDAASGIGTARFETFAGEAKGASKFLPIALLSGEGCNDAGSACLVANGALLEVGYNLTALGKPEKSFSGIQITTPEDSVVGTFTVNPSTLPTVTCPSNLTNCTANDVTTTVKAVGILNNDLCTSLTDTIQLRITTTYAATSSERYDLGLFVSADGGTVREPSTALVCLGAAAQAGQGDNLAYPDADTDLFLSIDTTGHSSTPTTNDTCGDLRASAGPVDWTVDATVDCNIVNGTLRIPSCRVWEQNANHKTSCQTLQQAGTGSKCDCTDLVVTTQLNPCATTICNDNNACTDDSCRVVGTPGNLSAECVYTNDNTNTCDDNNSCTTDTCQAGVCTGTNSVTCSASDQCHDAGTCDPSTGTCSNPAKTDGSACTDGNACTTDTCQAGVCTSTNSVTCTASDQCHVAGTCDPSTGGCSNPAKTDGSACDDNNACTTDTCQAGVCTGTNSVTCTASDQCHNAGTCDSATGACSNPAKTDGSACDDNNACTTDSCQTGVCTGTNSVTCTASDQCHAAGTCDPSTGACSNPAKTDGSACDDNNACTTDSCQAGVCAGTNSVTCTPLDQCHVAGICDTATGACSNPNKANGASCDADAGGDAACDDPDTCVNGACQANHHPNTEVCRVGTSPCDPGETCNNGVCPVDICRDLAPKNSSP